MLDKMQERAVKCKRKNILVLAGAGCGKTYTIVERVKYLINNLNVDASKILCISFTNDAVNKLKRDINNKDVEVLTFHKLALNIIGRRKEVLSEDMLYDVIMDTFTNDALFGLYKINKDEMYKLIETFINLFKSKNYTLESFYKMINKADDKDKKLLKEVMKCYLVYETYLNRENIMDFNDMINLAINKVNNYKKIYDYIIIDEYQDTSITKLNLIIKLRKRNNANLFLVGDDFQSIYRFTGSDIKIITKIRRYFPFIKIIKLKKTYRNSNELVKITGKFIMKNPNQHRKKLVSDINIDNPVEIVYYNDLNKAMDMVIKEDKLDDIFILSRNNKDLDDIKISNINYKKMSIHKSKGLQSKYVFVININNNLNGFPNKYKDHKILKYVNNYKEYYPYEEERRLFYVALTRCTSKVYLFVPINNESIFIKEIKKYKNIYVRRK